ncbi:MAG: hypothetical protein A2086_04970 [Spirochaetes bacterium GWD1_27_9]|nr:MAG: hypothetical protein A2Z98_09735 [Spirochaetes bacterium GWB1_27_13]OHD20771.1 MAG: hypothetical protein A2Y34_01835 [Spirochaetes bacterium GWC1_27_15]OHD30084.1 MAG: hypothetical protein A2086_04970 [Spirochaetes bacterium GWD1_27_9]
MEEKEIVIENWIKPPKIIKYQNATLNSFTEELLVCSFNLPEKYAKNPFYINGREILKKEEMFWGKRFFYYNRFYSLREYYSKDNRLTAYYIDVCLPPLMKKNEVFIVDLKIDFWVMPDKVEFIILDEDELAEAIEKNLFFKEEIESCFDTVDFIKNKLNNKKFDDIFSNYKTSTYKEWKRYKEFYE